MTSSGDLKSGNGPTVTAAVPTLYGTACLGATIEAVLAQSLTEFDLLIVADRSTDGPPARGRLPRRKNQMLSQNHEPWAPGQMESLPEGRQRPLLQAAAA
jgi:hypothetical protein